MPQKRKRSAAHRPPWTGGARAATPASERPPRPSPQGSGTPTRQESRPSRAATPASARRAGGLSALARRLGVGGWLLVGTIALIGACLVFNYAATASAPVIDGIACQFAEGQVQHYHAELYIYVNGRQVQVPEGIGIRQTCLYALHTHDASGLVHIESPTARTYTLGNFFDIWGQPLSPTQLLGHPVDSTHALVVETFDAHGRPTVVTGDPRKIVLTAHETIYLLYNSPNVQPVPFTHWGAY
jgi:hypothetical protein